jgi:pimeloyl-ACP methyl ester carboxylesterase
MWSSVVDGETGPGSTYRLYMPANWNGELVVYAHGIVAPFAPVTQPAEGDAFAQIFGAQGFAVAMSSYTMNGLAVKDGAQRTHQLNGLFASKFGQPARTYLVGRSMGGYIVTQLAEKYPKQYDGVLSLCGVVGGFTAELSYVFHARLLFDYLYPHVLDPFGTVTSVPLPSDPSAALARVGQIQNAAGFAVATDSRPLPGSVQIALTDQTSMPLPAALGGPLTPQRFGAFVVTPVVLHAIFVDDIVQHTQGHFPFGNTDVTYSSAAPFMAPFTAAINSGVERVTGERDALNWIQHNGETSGDLSIPMVSLHTRYDTWVPIVTESIYRNKVAAHNAGDLLVQRTTEGFDHCNFTAAEVGKGLADLVAWVESPAHPTPAP